jgi:hypothetical protein
VFLTGKRVDCSKKEALYFIAWKKFGLTPVRNFSAPNKLFQSFRRIKEHGLPGLKYLIVCLSTRMTKWGIITGHAIATTLKSPSYVP